MIDGAGVPDAGKVLGNASAASQLVVCRLSIFPCLSLPLGRVHCCAVFSLHVYAFLMLLLSPSLPELSGCVCGISRELVLYPLWQLHGFGRQDFFWGSLSWRGPCPAFFLWGLLLIFVLRFVCSRCVLPGRVRGNGPAPPNLGIGPALAWGTGAAAVDAAVVDAAALDAAAALGIGPLPPALADALGAGPAPSVAGTGGLTY